MARLPALLKILANQHLTDQATNVSPAILAKIGHMHHTNAQHPLGILKNKISTFLNSRDSFKTVDSLDPVVSVKQNFDDLLIAQDHPGRAQTDTYYINREMVLRTHTSAHQSAVLKSKMARAYLLTADVFRRDEIDPTHYPVFHQMEGIRLFYPNEVEKEFKNHMPQPLELSSDNLPQSVHSRQQAEYVGNHLRSMLTDLMKHLFHADPNLQIRWVEAYFPFTRPSWEVEVFFNGKWLELGGCGVIEQEILNQTGNADSIGWAFGLGLERIAMVLFDIPDIRLFWSTDKRFLDQFKSKQMIRFMPFSKYPSCYKDVSFWCPDSFNENDFAQIVRDCAGDMAEQVECVYYILI